MKKNSSGFFPVVIALTLVAIVVFFTILSPTQQANKRKKEAATRVFEKDRRAILSTNKSSSTADKLKAANAYYSGLKFEWPEYGVSLPAIQKDFYKARSMYLLAAEDGDASAQLQLGYMLNQGLGGEKNLSQALIWYESSALQGNVRALHNSANLIYDGLGVGQDKFKACSLYFQAARKGYSNSQHMLARCYSEYIIKHKRDRNEDKAIFWSIIAKENGYVDSNFDEAAKSFDYSRLEEIRRAAKFCIKSNYTECDIY